MHLNIGAFLLNTVQIIIIYEDVRGCEGLHLEKENQGGIGCETSMSSLSLHHLLRHSRCVMRGCGVLVMSCYQSSAEAYHHVDETQR